MVPQSHSILQTLLSKGSGWWVLHRSFLLFTWCSQIWYSLKVTFKIWFKLWIKPNTSSMPKIPPIFHIPSYLGGGLTFWAISWSASTQSTWHRTQIIAIILHFKLFPLFIVWDGVPTFLGCSTPFPIALPCYLFPFCVPLHVIITHTAPSHHNSPFKWYAYPRHPPIIPCLICCLEIINVSCLLDN